MVDSNDVHNLRGTNLWLSGYAMTDTTFFEFSQMIPGLTAPDGPYGPAFERLLCLALVRGCKTRAVPIRTPGVSIPQRDDRVD